MACFNPVPKLYRSVIEDVIEGVRNLFAEEGIEEQVLKDLKQLWETKVLQSKATEDFFRNSIQSPLFTLQLPHSLHQTLQSATGHLYKVNVPIMVTQTSGRAGILQHPIQQVFQQLGQPSVIQTSVPQLNPCSLQATTEKSQRIETVLQQPTVLPSGPVDRKHLENAASDILVSPGNEHKIVPEALLRHQESSQYVNLPGVVFSPQVSQTNPNVESVLSGSASMTQNLHDESLSTSPHGALHQHVTDIQLHILKNGMYGCESVKQPRNTEEPSNIPVSEKDSNSRVDLSIRVTDDDTGEIIQVDGTGDTSSNEETGSARDVDENEFLGVIDAGDLKVLEEEADSISNEDSATNSSDNEDPQVDIVEEDPLNSGDDVSEQDVPDLFDTDNVIVCQYDKIHRSKNKWKFYLKDGVMCFGGRDYVFAKAIGDAEW
uniref:Stonin 1 n=1 Tax=Macaca mulatta TaxID=9544 RepID=F7FZJ9_MACMU